MNNYGKGTLVWFRDQSVVWKAGSIVDSTDSEYVIETQEEEMIKVSRKDESHLRNIDE